MLRRRFIQLSGFSAASLLCTGWDKNARTPYLAMDLPSEVALLSAGQWRPLTGSGNRWTLDQASVELEHTGAALFVRVQAPGLELEKVRLGWKRSFPAAAKNLGDHWERSYGDLEWEPVATPRKAPWYLLVYDGRETTAFGIMTGANSMGYWQAAPDGLQLFLDTRSGGAGVLLGERTLHAAAIVTTKSLVGETPFQTDHRFCKLLCEKPLLPAKPVYGINDWYFAYGNNSRELILQHTHLLTGLAHNNGNRPFSVIDAGWSEGRDLTRSNKKFGDMSTLTEEIRKAGMRPGLWTRALQADSQDRQTILLPLRSDQQAGSERFLDPTIPENLERIAAMFRLYKDWGFELIKHDYTSDDFFGRWGFEMNESITAPGWFCSDRTKTNAEILLELYRTIRRAAGDMLLIGCNTVSHLSAGIFELNRTGDDTSGKEWARTLKMGVNTMGFRLPQHKAFYAVDGDCVGLTTAVPWKENRQWMQLLAESSAPLFISAQPEALGQEQRIVIKHCFDQAAVVLPLGEPLDWLTNPRPAKWKLNGRIVEFDWS